MVARFLERVRLKQLFGTFAESGVMNNDRLFQFSATFFIILRAEMFYCPTVIFWLGFD